MSSTILMVIVLVVMWLVVLVPMFVRRHDETAEARSTDRFATAMRVLSRRPRATAHAPAARASRPPAHPSAAAEPRPSSAAVHVRAEARRRMLARRRRTLGMFAMLTGAGMIGAVTISGWWWTAAGVGVALFTGYLVWLRQEVRRQQERRLRRAAAFSRRRPSQPAHPVSQARTVRAARRKPAVDPSVAPAATAPSAPAAQRAADGTWQPIPVPVPTYVTKLAARRPGSDSVVALDDDDPTFAEIEDVVPPIERRHAVNG